MPSNKKVVRVRVRKSGTAVGQLILAAVANPNERNGVALPTIKKALTRSGYDVKKNATRIRVTLRNMIRAGELIQIRGVGATAVYKINDGTVVIPPKRSTSRRRARPKGKKQAGKKRAGKKRRATKRTSKKKTKRARKTKKSKRSRKSRRRPKKGGRKKRARKAPGKKAPRRRRRATSKAK